MALKSSLFLNQNIISSKLDHYLSLSDNNLITLIISFISTSLTFFQLFPSHACRRRREIEVKEGDEACCPKTRCVVCLDDVFCDDGNGVSTLAAGCDHSLHKDCFEKWLEYNPTCPICRAPVRRGSRKGWLHCLWRFLLGCLLRWMDRHFDSELALAFCNGTTTS